MQFELAEAVILNVGLTAVDIRYWLRALTWYHNGAEVIPNGRITLSNDNTTLTITNATEFDSGVYEVKFAGLLVHPYRKICEAEVTRVLQHYPLLRPVVFHLYMDFPGKQNCGISFCFFQY